jgi:hypothetical protein
MTCDPRRSRISPGRMTEETQRSHGLSTNFLESQHVAQLNIWPDRKDYRNRRAIFLQSATYPHTQPLIRIAS